MRKQTQKLCSNPVTKRSAREPDIRNGQGRKECVKERARPGDTFVILAKEAEAGDWHELEARQGSITRLCRKGLEERREGGGREDRRMELNGLLHFFF